MKDNKGHQAERPKQIPSSGWKDVLLRVKNELGNDNIGIVAAGVAFYFFLAVFPALVTAISIYGLVMDPAEVGEQLSAATGALPEQAHQMLEESLKSIAGKSDGTLGWSLLLGILVSLWSANQGTKSLFEGVNIAYNERNERGFFKNTGITLLFTLCGIILALVSIALVVGFPAMVDQLALSETVKTIIGWTRWLLLGIILVFTLAAIYKYAPDRDNPQFKWVSWGAVIATMLWIGGSLLFSWYVNNFGSYEETYGAVAAVIILMLWLQLTSFIILLGAEINSELEHQTEKDTTIGESRPMGEREAFHADHVAHGHQDRKSEERSKERKPRDRDRERKH